MALAAFRNWFGKGDERAIVRPLYEAIVAEARQPHWYEEGAAPDTIDGRFDMVNAVLALVLIRMEALGEDAHLPSTLLAETFVDDMDGQLRELGIGDIVVGKHIGKMMSALGGRLGAYRAAFAGSGDLREVLARNLYRGEPVADETMEHVIAGIRTLQGQLADRSLADLLAGRLLRT